MKGLLRVNQAPKDPTNPILDQPSLIYHFKVPAKLLRDGKKITIKLNSIHGEFMMLAKVNEIPSIIDNKQEFDPDGKDAWLGGDLRNIVISSDDLDEDLNSEIIVDELPKRVNKDAYKDELLNFYIRVYPFVLADTLEKDPEKF